MPPRDLSMLNEMAVTQSVRSYLQPESSLVRSGSEHSLLMQSVSLVESGSRFQSGDGTKLRVGLLPHRRGSLNPVMDKSLLPNSPSRKSDKKSKKSKKKADTFGGHTSSSAMSSPARSATMMFGNSPTHNSMLSNSLNMGPGGGAGMGLNLSASLNAVESKGKKSKWKMLQSKVGKKFKHNITEEEEVPRNKPKRSNSSPSGKKYAVGVNRSFSINEEDIRISMASDRSSISGVVSPRSRKASSSQQVCNGKVLAKVFHIFNAWVMEYYEVS